MTNIATSNDFKEARHELRLTISQAAELCNVNTRTIRRWETGAGHGDGREPHPSACRILEIALSQHYAAPAKAARKPNPKEKPDAR